MQSHYASSPRVVALAACILLIAMSGTAVWAQIDAGQSDNWLPPPTPSGTQPTVGNDIMPVSLTNVLGKIALIGVLIYAAMWGLKQWKERGISAPRSGRGGLIRVRESVSLNGSSHLYVVQFGSRNLLIAGVGDRVTLLTGNSASEMDTFDTSSLPVQDVDLHSPVDESQYQRQSHGGNGGRLQAENLFRTTEWERKRDALVRALQNDISS